MMAPSNATRSFFQSKAHRSSVILWERKEISSNLGFIDISEPAALQKDRRFIVWPLRDKAYLRCWLSRLSISYLHLMRLPTVRPSAKICEAPVIVAGNVFLHLNFASQIIYPFCNQILVAV